MKKLIIMVMTVAVAAVIYFVGCGIIDRTTAIEPDYVGKINVQPGFTNTVRSW